MEGQPTKQSQINVFKGTFYSNLHNFWLGDPFAVIQKVEERRIKGESQAIIILF